MEKHTRRKMFAMPVLAIAAITAHTSIEKPDDKEDFGPVVFIPKEPKDINAWLDSPICDWLTEEDKQRIAKRAIECPDDRIMGVSKDNASAVWLYRNEIHPGCRIIGYRNGYKGPPIDPSSANFIHIVDNGLIYYF